MELDEQGNPIIPEDLRNKPQTDWTYEDWERSGGSGRTTHTTGPTEIAAGLMIAPQAVKAWGLGKVLDVGMQAAFPDAEDTLFEQALSSRPKVKAGAKATRLLYEKIAGSIFDQRLPNTPEATSGLLQSLHQHPQIGKLSKLQKQTDNRNILDQYLHKKAVEGPHKNWQDQGIPQTELSKDISDLSKKNDMQYQEKFNPDQTELNLEPFQSNKYQRSVLTKMRKYGMGDGTFRMKAYNAYLNKGDSGRDMLEAYLSPDRLRGSFEGYKKFNKGSWEYKWGNFLEKKGYDLKQGIQVHHINPLHDSIHLFDNVKFNSKEYWSLMDILVRNNARPGVIQKGDDINNLMMTLGQKADETTPHGIAHKFYNNFTPEFFSPTEMKKINTVKGYRNKKAKRWATLVNKSEEVILEAHKQWSALNPEINIPFDELIEQMSGYTDLGYNKLIDPKYQVPDIANIVEEIVTSKAKRGRKPKIQNTLNRLFPDVDPETGNIQGNLFDQ